MLFVPGSTLGVLFRQLVCLFLHSLSFGSNLHLICAKHRLLSLHKGLGLCSIKRKDKENEKKKTLVSN